MTRFRLARRRAGRDGDPRPGQAVRRRVPRWLDRVVSAGYEVVIPEVVDYEVRRELVRLGASAGLKRLDGLQSRFAYLPITTAAMVRAADCGPSCAGLGCRRPGRATWTPTRSSRSGGHAGLPDEAVIIATANLRHLGRFPGLDAREGARSVDVSG